MDKPGKTWHFCFRRCHGQHHPTHCSRSQDKADPRIHGTTHENPIDRFLRDERISLRPLPLRAIPVRRQRLSRMAPTMPSSKSTRFATVFPTNSSGRSSRCGSGTIPCASSSVASPSPSTGMRSSLTRATMQAFDIRPGPSSLPRKHLPRSMPSAGVWVITPRSSRRLPDERIRSRPRRRELQALAPRLNCRTIGRSPFCGTSKRSDLLAFPRHALWGRSGRQATQATGQCRRERGGGIRLEQRCYFP